MTHKRQLLHLSPLAAYGGCEVNCLRVVQALDGVDHHVLVFGERGPMSAEWEKAGAKVEHLGHWEGGSARFAAALSHWSEKRMTPESVIYWSNSRLPVVLRTLRNWDARWAVHLGNPLRPGMVALIRRQLSEWMLPRGRTVTLVACSSHVAESHRDAVYYRRFPMQVIHNPVEPALDRARRHRPLPIGSAPRVGMVARLDRIKDHLTVIRALAAAAPARPDIVVEFAGDGPLLKALREEAHRLGVSNRVVFHGFVPVAPLLSQWDLYVHSTTASEGMGTAVAEAMMAGLPCLVSDLPVMREVCGCDGAAYAPSGDAAAFSTALVQLLSDALSRTALGRAAQDRARRMFGLTQIANGYSRVVFPSPSEANP